MCSPHQCFPSSDFAVQRQRNVLLEEYPPGDIRNTEYWKRRVQEDTLHRNAMLQTLRGNDERLAKGLPLTAPTIQTWESRCKPNDFTRGFNRDVWMRTRDRPGWQPQGMGDFGMSDA